MDKKTPTFFTTSHFPTYNSSQSSDSFMKKSFAMQEVLSPNPSCGSFFSIACTTIVLDE